MFMEKIIKRIPGIMPLQPKEQGQGYIDDLSKKQKFELEELLKRQNKILANKNFISKLPDKGEKIRNFRDKILKELQHKDETERVTHLLSQLNIACKGKAAMTKLEWTGKYDKNKDVSESEVVELDSDDEEDPLNILSQSTKTSIHKKKIIREIPKESLIKPEDIEEINSFKTDLDTHVKYIIDKVEKTQTNKKKELFKPFKRIKTNVDDSIKEKQRKLPKYWEVTAATPPFMINNTAKILDLNESLKLQQEQIEKRKIILAKCAIERVTDQIDSQVDAASKDIKSYDMTQNMNDLLFYSSCKDEDEIYEDDEDKDSMVTCTLDSRREIPLES